MGLDLAVVKLNDKAFAKAKKNNKIEWDDGDFVGEVPMTETLSADWRGRVGSYGTIHGAWRRPLLDKTKMSAIRVDSIADALYSNKQIEFTDKELAVVMFYMHSDCDGIFTIDQLAFMADNLLEEFQEIYKDNNVDGDWHLVNWAKILEEAKDKRGTNIVLQFC